MWTAVGLSRGAFFGVLALAVGCFLFVPEPVWVQPRAPHFARIVVSYAVILPAVVVGMWRERPFPVGRAIAATAVIALVKLVVTALLLVAIVAASR
jgi:hypothetical protein